MTQVQLGEPLPVHKQIAGTPVSTKTTGREPEALFLGNAPPIGRGAVSVANQTIYAFNPNWFCREAAPNLVSNQQIQIITVTFYPVTAQTHPPDSK